MPKADLSAFSPSKTDFSFGSFEKKDKAQDKEKPKPLPTNLFQTGAFGSKDDGKPTGLLTGQPKEAAKPEAKTDNLFPP